MLHSTLRLASNNAAHAFKNDFGLAGIDFNVPALRSRDGTCSTLKPALKHLAAARHDTICLTGEFTKQMRSLQMMKE